MKLCRFDGNRIGLVGTDGVRDVSEVLDALPPLRWPVPLGDQLIAALPDLRARIEQAAIGKPSLPIESLRLLSPVANPSKIIAAPLNYPLHVDESHDAAINHGVHMPTHDGFATPIDKYGLFLKAASGLVGAGEGVALGWPGRRNDHEVELGVVIGKTIRHATRDTALDCVAGYAIALDMTVRGTEDRSFRKSADSYSVLGPWLVTADEIADPDALALSLTVDGEPRQASNTRHLICDVRDLIVRASAVYALHPGDIIMTGTPDGVGEVWPGATIHAEIEGIGAMDVKVR
jgi:2-keto-4-pentenoate hydratase/2-oxohepta-3-ene-1,7-dioic acid hydratase in catechol pathway